MGIKAGVIGALVSVLGSSCLAAPSTKASVIVDFDTKKVTRMNDGIPVLIVKENGKYSNTNDFDQSNPAGKGKSGYSTQREIKGDDIVNTNKGVNGLLLTSFVSGVSVETKAYSAGQLREMNRISGQSLNNVSGETYKAIQNYAIVSSKFGTQNKSKSRFAGGPLYRGSFAFD